MNTLNSELVSIVLPVYNGEKYISLSIQSCLKQTHKNIELIIVNDCSTDSTLSIINQYAKNDSRVRIINNKENKKLPASLNIGHKAANGNFITWTSDDNFYNLNAIEELLSALKENSADIVYSDFFLIDNSGNKTKEVKLLNLENIFFGNFIGCCFLYQKEVFKKNNGYNEAFFLVEDYDFWLRAVLHSKFYKLNKFLYNYRTHENTLTNQISTLTDKQKLWQKNISTMYLEFSRSILDRDFHIFSEFQTNILTQQKISFEWIIKNHTYIQKFQKRLAANINFSDKKLLQKVFMSQFINLMIADFNPKKNKSNCLFILTNYFFVLDINSFKTLIKYSLFK